MTPDFVTESDFSSRGPGFEKPWKKHHGHGEYSQKMETPWKTPWKHHLDLENTMENTVFVS